MANARNGLGIAIQAVVLGFSSTNYFGKDIRVKESSWPSAYPFYLPITRHSHLFLLQENVYSNPCAQL